MGSPAGTIRQALYLIEDNDQQAELPDNDAIPERRGA
jgi:hypothetical protein